MVAEPSGEVALVAAMALTVFMVVLDSAQSA
jgi:hypothetical protein